MATRYWVGGSGTWDAVDTTHWSTASGGAGGASVPGSADSVLIDASSGGGTITLAANTTCGSWDIRGFTGTFDFSTFVLNLTGNASTTARQDSTSTVSGTKTINLTYAGATGTRTIGLLTGITEANALTVNITAGTDIVTTTTGCVFNSLNFTGFAGTLSATAKTIYGSLVISSGMTCTAGTPALTFAATSGTKQITTNGNSTIDFPITFNGVGGTFQIQDNCTVGSTRTVTLTNGTLDLNSKTLSTGIFSSNNSNIRSVLFGTGNITITGSGATVYNCGTGTNFTFTGTPVVNLTYSGSTGTRTVSSASIDPSINNAISINVSAGSDTITFGNAARSYNSVDFTGFTGTCTELPKLVYGNLTLVSGMTLGATVGQAITFASISGTKTITTAGKTIDNPITFDGIGGTWSFADALTQGSTRAFTITNGTVKLKAGATSTVGAFATSGSNQKYLQSTTAGSQATLSQASGTVTVSYLSIKDIAATGGATWNAYVDYNNVDQGDNTGWDFSNSPAIDNEFPIALRSFTQPKRF